MAYLQRLKALKNNLTGCIHFSEQPVHSKISHCHQAQVFYTGAGGVKT